MADSWLATERQPRDSLAAKIIFFVFVSTFVSSLVVSWVAVHSTFAFLRGQLQQLYPVTLHAAAQALERAEPDLAPRLGQLAREPAIVGAADGESAGRALALLAERVEAHGLLHALALYDATGQLRAATPGASSEYAAPADGRLALAGGRLVLGVPVRAPGGRVVGRLDALLAPLEQVFDVDDPVLASWLAVVDAEGRVLARCHPAPDGAFASFPPALLAEQRAGVDEAPLRSFRSPDGRRALGAVRPLPVRDWHLVVAQPVTKAYAPVLAVLTRIFVIDLAVVLLFSFLAYEITAAIVRPLEQLSEAARRISHGELEVEIAAGRRHDEIGLLTRTFNDMARRLRRNHAELEQQHRQLREQNEQLQQANEVLEQLSITDGLTKLHNHRYFQETLTREIKRVSRTGDSLALLLIDIDDFKALNDRLGHAAGDAVLVRIARILNESVRESDVLARYGGEEFVVLAPGTDLEGVAYLAEKVRTAVAEASFGHDTSGKPLRVTVSIGVAQYAGDRREFFDTADRALYRAKAAGKNCVMGLEELMNGQA